MFVTKTQYLPNFYMQHPQKHNFKGTDGVVQEKDVKNQTNYKPLVYTAASVLLVGGLAATLRCQRVKKSSELSHNMKKIQKEVSSIFQREYSKEETIDFVNRYKKVLNTEYGENYYNMILSELKKDYKFENKNLTVQFCNYPNIPNSRNKMVMYTEALSRHIGVFDYQERTPKSGFCGMFHEGRHVKQFEIMYRTDKNRLAEIKVKELEESNNASYRAILRENRNDKLKAREYIRRNIENTFSQMYSHLEPLRKDSPEYKMGLKYLDNEANRISGHTHSLEEYKAQILEKEAYEIEDKAAELYELLKKESK